MTGDIERRKASIRWFEGDVPDADGNAMGMYAVVVPIADVLQFYAEDRPAIQLAAGTRCLVLGSADGDMDHLWMEVDEPGEFATANILIARAALRRIDTSPL